MPDLTPLRLTEARLIGIVTLAQFVIGISAFAAKRAGYQAPR
jgi:hypothetical protein